MPKLSDKTNSLQQSGIRAASTRCAAIQGINLGQGICDLPIVEPIKQAAYLAIQQDHSTYSACEGLFLLRQKLAKKMHSFNQMTVDPHAEIVITHGSTGAFVAAIMTLFNPGDEVILFEPFYGYHKNILELQGLSVRAVPLCLENLTFAEADLERAITAKTKGIVICTPNNPSGKVFSKEELSFIGNLAEKHDLFVITDEIYEYITYPGYEHVSLASLGQFKERTVTISGFSKTYNMTGWRMGYAVAPADIAQKMSLIQDLLYVCPATPLQHAVLAALDLPQSYYDDLRAGYLHSRNFVVQALRDLGFKLTEPQGAYYLMADFSALGFANCDEAAQSLLDRAKVATVPGSAFYIHKSAGNQVLRFCYALTEDKLERALGQLRTVLATA